MIPYKHRFHGYNSLRYVSKNGTAIRSQYMTLKYSHNPKRPSVRAAVVVSKKIHKGAVGRNRIRRRVYEQIRLHLGSIQPHTDMVIYITSATVRTLPPIELQQMISSLLQEAGVCNEAPKNGMIVQKEVVQ